MGFVGDRNKQAANPVPVLTSLSPTTAVAGDAGFTLTVNGTGFILGSAVHWNGAARSTTFVSSTELEAAIAAADVAVPVSVAPAPG